MHDREANIYVLTASLITVALLFFVTFAPLPAKAISAGVPFGGRIIVPIPIPLFCPPHIIIYDFVTKIPLALAIPPIDPKAYQNNFVPGIAVLGLYEPVPLPCILPYPVFPMIVEGTSLFPGF